jgi:hypothetical protein
MVQSEGTRIDAGTVRLVAQDLNYYTTSGPGEIYTHYKYLNSVDDIKIIRLGWAGHIIRLEEDRISRKVLNP